MSEKLHAAFDMDDVILNFCGGLQHAVETEYDVVVPDFDRWEISDILDPLLGQSWWKWLRERDWLWPNFPAVKGAIGTLTQLREDGHYLEIITSKPEWAEYAVWKWLGKWRPPVHRVTIVSLADQKVDVTDADLLVDDKLENVQGFDEDGRLGILYTRPHNATLETTGDIIRARDWRQVRELITLESEGVLL